MQSVLITGATSGIGASTARRFSTAGFKVYLLGRNREGLAATQKSLKGPAELLVSDLSNQTAFENLLKDLKANEEFNSTLKVLVNNAGAFQRVSISEMSSKHLQDQYHLQVQVPTLLSAFCAPYLGRHKTSGAIVNVSSTLGLRPIAMTAHYSAAKAAMVNMSQSMAIEFAPKIRVNCICPGLVDTPIHTFDPESRKAADQMQPLGRMGKPDEIAEAIHFLASDFSQWTTGSVLSVDGGIGLR